MREGSVVLYIVFLIVFGLIPCIILAPIWLLGILFVGWGLTGLAGTWFLIKACMLKYKNQCWDSVTYSLVIIAMTGISPAAIPAFVNISESIVRDYSTSQYVFESIGISMLFISPVIAAIVAWVFRPQAKYGAIDKTAQNIITKNQPEQSQEKRCSYWVLISIVVALIILSVSPLILPALIFLLIVFFTRKSCIEDNSNEAAQLNISEKEKFYKVVASVVLLSLFASTATLIANAKLP